MDDSVKDANRISEVGFIRSASIHILSSLIKYRNKDDGLPQKAVNLAIQLNDEINKSITQK